MEEDDFGKDGRGNRGSISSQSIFLDIVVKGISKASLNLKKQVTMEILKEIQ